MSSTHPVLATQPHENANELHEPVAKEDLAILAPFSPRITPAPPLGAAGNRKGDAGHPRMHSASAASPDQEANPLEDPGVGEVPELELEDVDARPNPEALPKHGAVKQGLGTTAKLHEVEGQHEGVLRRLKSF